MSRIGKKPIVLPAGIDAQIDSVSVTLTSAKQSLHVKLPPHAHVTLQAEPRALSVVVDHPNVVSENSVWGLTRQLLQNAVKGLEKPFEKTLEFIGVGFKVALEGRTIVMDLGFSHSVRFPLPEGVDAKVEKQLLTLSSADKYLIGETAARIRSIKPPEPYKGKGIKYTTEVIRRKAGKTAKTAA
ncbi:MAG TPA: 50S ribosomal protein L6 [Patescibacteria group bacterium]|nr:50S ribosomal protein L6 [Patescibacteria group bacterium]